MVTGHGKLTPYLHRFGLTDKPMCLCEEEEEEEEEEGEGGGEEEEEEEVAAAAGVAAADHLIFQCKKLHNQRNEMVKQIKNTGGDQRTVKHWWRSAYGETLVAISLR